MQNWAVRSTHKLDLDVTPILQTRLRVWGGKSLPNVTQYVLPDIHKQTPKTILKVLPLHHVMLLITILSSVAVS